MVRGESVAQAVEREIRTTYPGYEPIPPQLGDEVISDVLPPTMGGGEVTVYLCLLSFCWSYGSVREDTKTIASPKEIELGPDEYIIAQLLPTDKRSG